jgi:hypothetical protein
MSQRFVHCYSDAHGTACDTDNVQTGPRIEGRRLALHCSALYLAAVHR